MIEAVPKLNATGILQDRIKTNSRIEVRCASIVEAISGKDYVHEPITGGLVFIYRNNRLHHKMTVSALPLIIIIYVDFKELLKSVFTFP